MVVTALVAHSHVVIGDDPPHNVWNQTQEYNVNVSRIIANLFATGLPNTTFFPVLGNHNGVCLVHVIAFF